MQERALRETAMRTLDEVVSAEDAAWLRAFRRDLAAALPGQIEAVILFGSRARGDAEPDSDYDVAVVVKDGLAHDKRTRQAIADVEWVHLHATKVIETIALDAARVYPPASELAMRIAAEGVVLS